ncbi:phage integrase, N-terminal SAM-like domain protein [Mycobacterium kansasii 824]|nr:phage integrase, N-terminal SAM-like domain protein [Mycobacterium kansasii 824]
MARTQRIALADGPDTFTVLGVDHLPIGAVEEYLQFLRDDEASPNTVKAYARGLAAWWTVLEHTGTDWQQISTGLFGQFLAYLRTGDLPGTARIGAPRRGWARRAPSCGLRRCWRSTVSTLMPMV